MRRLHKGDFSTKEKIYVVENLPKSLLGRPAIMGLNMVWRIEAIKKSSQSQKTEPMIPTGFPDLPWQKVGMDLFEWKQVTYLTIVDYYSRYREVVKLDRMTAEGVILHCKSIFARHGILEVVIADNGSQFEANAFRRFSREFQFKHITSSPYYLRSNGEAERAVKTMKGLLKKEGNPYLALLAYRSTLLPNGYSPAELLMNRKLRTSIPSS